MLKYQNFISRLIVLVFVSTVFTVGASVAQDVAVIDSLKLRLKSATQEQRFELLQELFKAYNLYDFETALNYAQDSYKLALALGDSSKIVEGGRMIAYSLLDLGRNDEAIAILNRSLNIALRNTERYPELKPRIKYLLNNAGIAYMYRGNYDSSLSYHFRSLAIREEEGDKRSVGTALNNIGLVYFKLKNYEQALNYYNKSLDLKKELNDTNDLDKIYINIGLCYNSLSKTNDALVAFTAALKHCAPNCGEIQKKEAYFGLGYVYLNMSKLDSAESYFKYSLESAKSQNDRQYWVENLIGLLKIETKRKNYSSALKYLEEAKQFENELEYPEPLIMVYSEASNLYTMLGDFKSATDYQSRYIKLKDSIYSSQLIKNLASIQTTFEQRENLKTINEKNRVLQLQNELIRRQQIQYLFVVVILILSTGLALVLILSNQKQKRQTQALNQAKQLISEQNEKLKQANEFLDKQVEEKTLDLLKSNAALKQVNIEMEHFIYRTSHDIRGPLVTLKGVCNVAMLDVKDPVARDYFEKLDSTSNKLNIILTRLLLVNRISQWDIEPSRIDLNEVINALIEQRKEQSVPANMNFYVEVSKDVNFVSDHFLFSLILENLIDNAVKFYNASERITPFVKIMVKGEGDKKILIKVIDNGIGIVSDDRENIFKLFIRASDRSETGGIGLYISKLAAVKLGGEISLVSTSSSGSEFQVVLPSDVSPLVANHLLQTEQDKKEREIRDQKLFKPRGNSFT